MKILVTGATGFIGTYLCKRLINLGHDVIECDSNIFRNLSLIEDRSKSIDIVVHLGGNSSVDTYYDNPRRDLEDNVIPFLSFLNWVTNRGVKKIFFASSAGTIYGKRKDVCSEEMLPKPFSPYAIGKLAIEGYLEYAKNRFNIEYCCMRIANPYGPFNKPKGVVGNWLYSINTGNEVVLFGSGEEYKDYIYIDNLIEQMESLLNLPINQSGIYNLGSGYNYSLNEISQTIEKVTGKKLKLRKEKAKQSDNSFFKLDISKIKNINPNLKIFTLEEGVKKFWESMEHKK